MVWVDIWDRSCFKKGESVEQRWEFIITHRLTTTLYIVSLHHLEFENFIQVSPTQ